LGIIPPVVIMFPGRHGAWERGGTIDDVRRIAESAERFGYDYMTCPEHVAVPADRESGTTYWDPLPTFGYLAAFTNRIRFATYMLVLPYHHPLDVAKRYGTLDRICGGRLVLGVGAGYLEAEFAMLGADLQGRGDLTDDAIRGIRASFGRAEPVYEGTHFRFSGMVVDPCGVQQPPPIWVGGRTRRSLRRAVELADAWAPFGVSSEQVEDWLSRAARTDAWHRREAPLEVVRSGDGSRFDPIGARAETLAAARELCDSGATSLSLRFRQDSLEHYLDQLEAMAQLVTEL
jgi:probable F420-dependent oxidoreductase